ncbi:MAG TPA: hypothetical protein VLC98_15270 [Phnomibacter sp.]|nr:hypothetical protein [Phnomibacter sp.]
MKKILLLAISSFALWSCTNNDQKTPGQEAKQVEQHPEKSPATIELNNGEKWAVNEEMKPPITKGEGLVNAYIKSNQNNNKELAQQLKDQNEKLIKSCTMKGKSHDELHKWLLPHLALVRDLENSPTENDAKQIVLKLQSSFSMYHQYFE